MYAFAVCTIVVSSGDDVDDDDGADVFLQSNRLEIHDQSIDQHCHQCRCCITISS